MLDVADSNLLYPKITNSSAAQRQTAIRQLHELQRRDYAWNEGRVKMIATQQRINCASCCATLSMRNARKEKKLVCCVMNTLTNELGHKDEL